MEGVVKDYKVAIVASNILPAFSSPCLLVYPAAATKKRTFKGLQKMSVNDVVWINPSQGNLHTEGCYMLYPANPHSYVCPLDTAFSEYMFDNLDALDDEQSILRFNVDIDATRWTELLDHADPAMSITSAQRVELRDALLAFIESYNSASENTAAKGVVNELAAYMDVFAESRQG